MPRLLRNHPGYVALASVILALAIGINLLVFAIVNALWIRPLPVFEPEHVVTILQWGSTVASLDSPRVAMFEGPVAGQVVTTGFHEAFTPRIAFPQVAKRLETLGVTPHYFTVLGVPVRGRAFTDADERVGAEAVAIISDRLWARAFGNRADVIGSVVAASPEPLRIVGIAPPGFEGARRGEHAELWVPTQVVRQQAPDDRQLNATSLIVFARLGAGQTVAALEQRFRERLPLPEGHKGTPSDLPIIVPLTDVFGTSESPTVLIRESGTLAVVSGLSLLVLLGACATIAALVLTHYECRRPEFALKLSLGASPSRQACELTAELLLVATAGSAGALVCGLIGLRALPALSLPGGVNVGRLDLSVDWRLCAVALLASLATLAVAGAVSLWKVTRGRLANEVVTGPTTTLASLRIRQALLALQVCATTVVSIAAALFVQTVLYSFSGAAGFDLDRTVFVSVQEKAVLVTAGADWRSEGIARRARMSGILEQVPSVHGVAGGQSPIGDEFVASLRPRTVRVGEREERLLVGLLSGTSNLLATLGVPLLAGRALDDADATMTAPTPVVITRSLANRLWPTGDAPGKVFSIPELRIRGVVVGIVGDFAYGTLSRPTSAVIVTARGDSDFRASNLVLQAHDSRAVVAAVQQQLAGRVVRVATGREIVARDIAQQRLGAWAFSGFGLVAWLLGIGGVFGLVEYLAQSRRREFGVRMALGATLQDLLRHGVTTALRPVAVGVAAGLLVAAFVSRVFAALLVGIGGLDPGTYVGVGGAMLACAMLAALAGAWRLRRTTPSDALRSA